MSLSGAKECKSKGNQNKVCTVKKTLERETFRKPPLARRGKFSNESPRTDGSQVIARAADLPSESPIFREARGHKKGEGRSGILHPVTVAPFLRALQSSWSSRSAIVRNMKRTLG